MLCLVFHQPQLLTHFPPLGHLLTRTLGLVFGLEGLQQHTSIEEAICEKIKVSTRIPSSSASMHMNLHPPSSSSLATLLSLSTSDCLAGTSPPAPTTLPLDFSRLPFGLFSSASRALDACLNRPGSSFSQFHPVFHPPEPFLSLSCGLYAVSSSQTRSRACRTRRGRLASLLRSFHGRSILAFLFGKVLAVWSALWGIFAVGQALDNLVLHGSVKVSMRGVGRDVGWMKATRAWVVLLTQLWCLLAVVDARS